MAPFPLRKNGYHSGSLAAASSIKRRRHQSSWPCWVRLTIASVSAYLLFVAYFLVSFEVEIKRDSAGRTVSIPKIRDHTRQASNNRAPLQDVKKSSTTETQSSPMITKPEETYSYMQTTAYLSTGSFVFDREKAEAALAKYGSGSIRKLMSAYLEPPMNDTIPGTGSQGKVEDEKDVGTPPEFVIPLPLRTNAPEDLLKFQYPKLQTCRDVPGKIPVDRGLELDENGNAIVWNVGDDSTPADDSPLHCPVDADPFLPWIHDVFPSVDGTRIEFVAQNKRRCRTGKNFRKDLKRLEPQVALMQSVSVERIDEKEARSLAPELWHPSSDSQTDALPRYRLAPYEESAKDGQFTRFICRFHATDFSDAGQPRSIILGETLSTFPFNYEFVSYRKGIAFMLTPKGKDSKLFWTSNLRFECPVPNVASLAPVIASGQTILTDGTPTLHVDVIPIRTPPRYATNEAYFAEDMVGPMNNGDLTGFDSKGRWGDKNVIPRVEASGRWENIPLCVPPRLPVDDVKAGERRDTDIVPSSAIKKPHVLSACLWASASFRTRGANKEPIEDTSVRLEEWIEFHLMVGFDHIYVYDNSGAHTNQTSLAPVLDKFPRSKVTRIDWPSTVCNNNVPAHDNTGERSSQYAAENSCRTRHAHFTEWIASFDTDEYLVPMGKYDNLKDVLAVAANQGTNILSFRSSRARLHWDHSRTVGSGREKLEDATFLEAYNCDSSPSPKPSWADRARKQIYRSDYVLYHFVHYSTVTQGILTTYREDPKHWRRQWGERSPSERVTDELNEATMLHTKTTTREQANNWKKRCHFEFEKKWRGCYVGIPFPPNFTKVSNAVSHREDGMEYNCYENSKVTSYWAPRLRSALLERRALPAESAGN